MMVIVSDAFTVGWKDSKKLTHCLINSEEGKGFADVCRFARLWSKDG
jgi:hypothetical protein